MGSPHRCGEEGTALAGRASWGVCLAGGEASAGQPEATAPGTQVAAFSVESEHRPLHAAPLLSEKLQGSLLLLVHLSSHRLETTFTGATSWYTKWNLLCVAVFHLLHCCV